MVLYKNYPLPMHSYAGKAAVASLAANRQGAFAEFSQKLYDAGSGLNDEKVQAIARDAKLDMEKFNRDLNDSALQALVNRDIEEGRQAEVQGTPSVFLNGKSVNLRSLQDLEQMIQAELKKKK